MRYEEKWWIYLIALSTSRSSVKFDLVNYSYANSIYLQVAAFNLSTDEN